MDSSESRCSLRCGVCLAAAGALFILAALCLVGFNVHEDWQARRQAEAILAQVEGALPLADAGTAFSGPAEEPGILDQQGVGTAAIAVDGSSCIGILRIPALELALPVMRELSYPSLRKAPCRWQGSAQEGDLIIAAHNYDSHFGRLKNLQAGDAVTFTDADGRLFRYRVSEQQLLEGTAVEEMRAGEWDLTLFTCTVGGKQRVTVRCMEVGE